MPENRLISIITVNLNDVEGLKRTMTSVFEQTFKEFEYIVIDGSSIDGSKEYIESHSDKIDTWVSEKDFGIYNAMNKGINVSSGKFILFLNSGDELINSGALHKNNEHLKESDVYYFNIKVKDQKRTFIKYPPVNIKFSFLYYSTIPHQSAFIKKELFNKVGLYDDELKIVSDWKFFINAFYKYNASFEYINETLSIFYLGGVSSNMELILLEREKVMNTDFSMIYSDIKNYLTIQKKLDNLKSSKKINFLIKLGILNKF